MIDAIGKNVNLYAYKPQQSKVNFTAQPDEFVKQDDNKEEKKGLSKRLNGVLQAVLALVH